jgi:hypothetical protein
MKRQFLVATAIVVSVLTSTAAQEKPAQDKPSLAPAQPPASTFTGPRIPLRVQVVLSRYLGEKKISSMPYMLGVLSNAQKTSLRMGIQVPVTTTIFGSAKTPSDASVPSSSYSYRDVGTNIDCQAADAGAGQYNLVITISDSSIHLDSSQGGANKQQIVRDVPVFRSFNASFSMLLRDGQTMQYASATDSISGEVVRIDVTLSLAK